MESSDLFPDVGGMDLGFDFDVSDFTLDVDSVDGIRNQRYQAPRATKPKTVAYENARQLVRDIDFHREFRAFCLLSGNFIFGDFLEAMSELDVWRIDRLTIHTLTMSQDTIDSIANIIAMDQPSQLHVIMSDYWYAHERNKRDGLLWELYDKLDIGDGFRLAFCRTHAKICTVQTKHGGKLVMHGSANMRSHGVIEQMEIENSPELYDFIERFNDGILDEYDIINRGVKRKRPVSERKTFEKAVRS